MNQQHPIVTVGALIIGDDEKILLIKSHKWRNKYVMVGGKLEVGETMEKGVAREIKEEVGLDVFDIKLLTIFEYINDVYYYKKRHFIFLDFTCRTRQRKVIINDEAESFAWLTSKEALNDKVEPYTRKAIGIYLKSKKS